VTHSPALLPFETNATSIASRRKPEYIDSQPKGKPESQIKKTSSKAA
jgi:hypothetical protein